MIYRLTDHYYLVSDKLGTCSIYLHPLLFDHNESYQYQVSIELEGATISGLYSLHISSCIGSPHLGSHFLDTPPLQPDAYDKAEIDEGLRQISTTSDQKKVFVYATQSRLPIISEDSNQNNPRYTNLLPMLQSRYPEILDDDSPLKWGDKLNSAWSEFLSDQETDFPIIFIEDGLGNLIRYVSEDYGRCV
jgi:hypothetical protein